MVINNLANFFTITRILLAPIIFICILEPSMHIVALILFIFASFTDYLDGYFARKTNSVSVIGEVNSPGSVTLEFINESIESVINKVGGFTQNASLGASYILRDSLTIDFNFNKQLNSKKSFLTNGDVIIIVNNKREITISGAVNNASKLLFNKSRYS